MEMAVTQHMIETLPKWAKELVRDLITKNVRLAWERDRVAEADIPTDITVDWNPLEKHHVYLANESRIKFMLGSPDSHKYIEVSFCLEHPETLVLYADGPLVYKPQHSNSCHIAMERDV